MLPKTNIQFVFIYFKMTEEWDGKTIFFPQIHQKII